MLILSRSDVQAAVPMGDAIALMKTAFQELSAGRAISPIRTVVPVDDAPSMLLMMPAFVPAEGALGYKTVGFFGNNRERGLPAIHALVSVVDPDTGEPSAVMEGGWLTALRTGAVSGAATDLLARPESSTLTVIGAGVQGVTQTAAVCEVRPIDRIIAVDVSSQQLETFVESIAREWPTLADRVEVSQDAASAVACADVICTSTTSRTPVFPSDAIAPGTHINGVGSFTPEMQEIPADVVGRAVVVVDQKAAALEEAGDLIQAIASGALQESALERELGLVMSGEYTGRTSDEEITFFKSVGNAVQDVVVARRAVDKARTLGLGTEISLYD